MCHEDLIAKLEDVYAILNDPDRPDKRARMDARLRTRSHIAELNAQTSTDSRQRVQPDVDLR